MSEATASEKLIARAKDEARVLRRRMWRASKAPGARGEVRMVTSPVFLLSSIRSGSTLLRVILNSHSQVCAPHELHMNTIKVKLNANSQASMKALDFDPRALENLLWDRMLHLELTRSGKSIIVDKTPSNTFAWKRLQRSWPKARYLFLLRHPVRILESMVAAWGSTNLSSYYDKVNQYSDTLDEARKKLPGFTVRYEELTANPQLVVPDLCAWLRVPYEPAMLRYVEHDHGAFASRLGDWHDTIKSGVIRPPAPDPELADVPPELRDSCRKLGYL